MTLMAGIKDAGGAQRQQHINQHGYGDYVQMHNHHPQHHHQQQQQQQPQTAGPAAHRAQRRSLFRRSLAWFGGGQAPIQGPIQDWPDQNGGLGGSPALAHPRLVTMSGETAEKPSVTRKSLFLGGGAQGNEWDVNGDGSHFWRRFASAQRVAQAGDADPINASSRKWLRKERRGHCMLICMATFFGLTVLAGIAAVVVWREMKPHTHHSDVPPALEKANLPPSPPSAASFDTSDAAAAQNIDPTAYASPAMTSTGSLGAASVSSAAAATSTGSNVYGPSKSSTAIPGATSAELASSGASTKAAASKSASAATLAAATPKSDNGNADNDGDNAADDADADDQTDSPPSASKQRPTVKHEQIKHHHGGGSTNDVRRRRRL
ncbi:hypothetical protein OC835_000802 [Tilletia horrida]|nr:hypothetical protein OC835_000802 [Tilletia horrida]